MKLSVVIPIFNEADTLPTLCQRLTDVLKDRDFDFEIVFVNDGSADDSSAIIQQWIKREHRVCLLELSRNFGHQAAITAGLKEATGEAVVVMDGDGQDPVEFIPEMLAAWKQGAKVVIAERISRKETLARRALFCLFYKLFAFLSDPPLQVNSGVFGLMDRIVVDHLLALPEHNRFIPGLRNWIGFETVRLSYARGERLGGEPKQSLKRLIKYGSDAVFSFSYKPLHLSLYAGLMISALAFLYGGYLLALRLLNINVVSGFTTVAVAVFFFSGVILISNGLIGEYLSRVYDEVKRRPLYIPSRKTSRQAQDPDVTTRECE